MAVALGIILSRGAQPRRWPPVTIFVLASGLAALVLEIPWLYWLSALGGTCGLLPPMIMSVLALRRARSGRLRDGSHWARWVSWFNPAWEDVSRQWHLAAEYLDGRTTTVTAQLDQWTALGDERSLASRDAVYMLIGQWENLQYSSILEYRVRALVEVGREEHAALEFASAWEAQRGLRALRGLRRAALPLLAHTGRVETVRRLLHIIGVHPGTRHYWMHTVSIAAGLPQEAMRYKEMGLRHCETNPLLKNRWDEKSQKHTEAVDLEPPLVAVLDRVAAEIDCGYALRLQWFWQHPILTTMVALIGCGFALQWLRGGVHDPLAALSLGALLAEGHIPSQSWRLLAYGFLHFGWIHLLTNVIVLILAGPIVTRALGSIAFSICFLGGVACAGLSISLFGTPGVTVGASGGTMALIGALTACVLTEPRIRTTRWGRLVGFFLCALAILELATDALSPSISLAGHLGGLLFGCVFGWLRARMLHDLVSASVAPQHPRD